MFSSILLPHSVAPHPLHLFHLLPSPFPLFAQIYKTCSSIISTNFVSPPPFPCSHLSLVLSLLTYISPSCRNEPAFIFMCHTLRLSAIISVILYSFMFYLAIFYLVLALPLFPCTCVVIIFLVASSPSFLPSFLKV